MKILYILQDYRFFSGAGYVAGGHIAHIIGVVEAFQQRGHEVVIQTFDPVPYWNNPGATYRFFRFGKHASLNRRGPIRKLLLTRDVVKAVHEEKPDLLYVRWASNPFFFHVRSSFPDLPIVLECNSALEMALGGKPLGVLRRWLSHKVDRMYLDSAAVVSAVSAETRAFLVDRHPSADHRRVIVNPNGVDVHRFRPMESDLRKTYGVPENAVLAGYAGSFRSWHGIDLLIEAFQEMDRDDAFLIIMGSGPGKIEERLAAIARKGRSRRIIFTGSIPFDRMPEHLSMCDILVSPQTGSLGEAFHQSPIKLYEYMAVARAVVGSRIGQIQSVIRDGRNGLLFEPGSRQDLARVLKKAVEDRALRETLGRRARREVELRYSWLANVDRILAQLPSCSHVERSRTRIEDGRPDAHPDAHPADSDHKKRIEALYTPKQINRAIDLWSLHYARDAMDIEISNARHLDARRQCIENDVWEKIIPRDGRVIEIACGRGFFCHRLQSIPKPFHVAGCDLSENILAFARRENPGTPFIVGDAETLPLASGRFDAVLLISAIEQMEHPLPVIREIHRILKPGGWFYLCLHKPFIDPLVAPTALRKAIRWLKEVNRPTPPARPNHIGYPGTLVELRQNLKKWLRDEGFSWMTSRALLHQFEWSVYKRIAPAAVPRLIRLGGLLNRLPFSYYKDLEYWLLRKS